MNRIVINGQFLARRLTGQERFALETVKELDKLVKKNSLELVVPTHVMKIPNLENIKVVKYGRLKGLLWEQVDLSRYVIKNDALSINLCSIMPILKPGIICIHDLAYKVNPQNYKTFKRKLSQNWHKLFYHLAWRYSPLIYTVSEFSKQQMQDVYHVSPERIHVIPNGWQHFELIKEDANVFTKWPMLKQRNYFFSAGSQAPSKNLQWIYNAAKSNPNEIFAVAGKFVPAGLKYENIDAKNVILLGYVTDEEMKALMKNCKAFIFPSYFEGFGIPPLEAMSVGAKVIVSNRSCLPEIYEKSAIYIDPDNANVSLEELLKIKTEPADAVLDKYSYKKTAKQIYEDLVHMCRDV